jgi:hypothetical protein
MTGERRRRETDVDRWQFTGHIAGAGTTGGTRLVLGAWGASPHGPFADVMVAHPDGRRELLAPDDWVADFVSATYVFDDVRQVPVSVTVTEPAVEAGAESAGRARAESAGGDRAPSAGGAGRTARTGSRWTVRAGPLHWEFTVGPRSAWGHLLRAVPPRLGRTLAVARVSDRVASVVMPGVRTLGTAGNDRLEWYAARDLHRITASTASWDGLDLGGLTDMDPPPQFGFSSTPRTPMLTTLTSTVRVPR